MFKTYEYLQHTKPSIHALISSHKEWSTTFKNRKRNRDTCWHVGALVGKFGGRQRYLLA